MQNISRRLGLMAAFIAGNGEGKTQFQRWKESKRPRIDKNLPLGITIGGVISIDIEADLILADDLSMVTPANKGVIFAIGKIDIGNNLFIYKAYYLKSSLADKEASEVNVLHIECEGDKVLEVKVYTLEAELSLAQGLSEAVFEENDGSSIASIYHWIEAEQGLLGAPEFHTPKDEEDENFDVEDIKRYQYVFKRVSSPHVMKKILEERKELFYPEPYEEACVVKNITFCDYHRNLSDDMGFGGKEYLVQSLVETDQEAFIEICKGVKLDKESIKII